MGTVWGVREGPFPPSSIAQAAATGGAVPTLDCSSASWVPSAQLLPPRKRKDGKSSGLVVGKRIRAVSWLPRVLIRVPPTLAGALGKTPPSPIRFPPKKWRQCVSGDTGRRGVGLPFLLHCPNSSGFRCGCCGTLLPNLCYTPTPTSILPSRWSHLPFARPGGHRECRREQDKAHDVEASRRGDRQLQQGEIRRGRLSQVSGDDQVWGRLSQLRSREHSLPPWHPWGSGAAALCLSLFFF